MKDKIILYQQSINKFIIENKYNIEKSDNIISILALTIVNSLSKKSKYVFHGYYIALLIEVLLSDKYNSIKVVRIIDEHILHILSSNTITLDKLLPMLILCHKILDENMDININNKHINICKIALVISWILGCGKINNDITNELLKSGEYFGMLINIATNYNKDKDNYDEVYEKFTDNKIKFIEIMITYNIFTDTVKNLIDILENKIDVLLK